MNNINEQMNNLLKELNPDPKDKADKLKEELKLCTLAAKEVIALVAADDELTSDIATISANLLNKLEEKGFTRTEAFQLVLRMCGSLKK